MCLATNFLCTTISYYILPLGQCDIWHVIHQWECSNEPWSNRRKLLRKARYCFSTLPIPKAKLEWHMYQLSLLTSGAALNFYSGQFSDIFPLMCQFFEFAFIIDFAAISPSRLSVWPTAFCVLRTCCSKDCLSRGFTVHCYQLAIALVQYCGFFYPWVFLSNTTQALRYLVPGW